MAIKPNADGKTATVTRTGLTGVSENGRPTPRRNPLAQNTARVPKRLPIKQSPVSTKKR